MTKTIYVCSAVSSFSIAYGDFNNFEILFCCPEDEIKVTKRVKIAEITPIGPNLFIIIFKKGFGSAESILEPLVQNPGEHQGKKFIFKIVQKSYGLFFHGIDQAAAIDELSMVLDKSHIKLGGTKALSYRITFAPAIL